MLNKTQCHLITIAFQWSIVVVLALFVLAGDAPAELAKAGAPTAIDGVYNGAYAGQQGPVKFKLSITREDTGKLNGTFTLYLPDGSGTKTYTCDVTGSIGTNGTFVLGRRPWDNPPPASVVMVGIDGKFDANGDKGAGQISGKMRSRPAPEFQATRDRDESAKLVVAIGAKKAAVAAASLAAINGVYVGEYHRGDGDVKLKLSIKSTEDGSLTGLFTFELPGKAGSFITFKLTGRYDAGAHDRWGNRLDPFQFTTIEPVGSDAKDALVASKAQAARVGIIGLGSINGSLTGSDPKSGTEFTCARFNATKDRAASADLDKVMTAQVSAGSSAAAAVAPVAHRQFEGVYTGSYATKQGPTKLKLKVWIQRENKTAAGQLVNTEIAGLLTIYLAEGSETKAYTSDITGYYITSNRTLQAISRRWDIPLPPNFRMAGLQGQFDTDAAGQISGFMSDATNSKFQAVRDAAESAAMDSTRLRNNLRPGIEGVFHGTYTRANEPPTKFKLTITHNGDGPNGIVGMATIYLPVGSGTKAYTYDLLGSEDGRNAFHLLAGDWETIPPKDFKDFRSMGFNGSVVLNLAENAARIVSAPENNSFAALSLPKFDAAWNATESADIKGTLAAQKAVGDADLAAAMKAREQTIKNSTPKELASKDLVRKSRQYWQGFQTDMIREVFDGGFGAAIDENGQFQALFCTYVETFSAKCPDCLPANHQTVTVTQKTNRKFDANGNLINQDVRTFTIEMDPRFVDAYQRFSKSLSLQGTGLRGALAAMQTPGGAQQMLRDMLAIATDMQKFFADHDGPSAAMHQMNENFLRAITGEPSLQQAGGKIEGAEAESDKNLPPRLLRAACGCRQRLFSRAGGARPRPVWAQFIARHRVLPAPRGAVRGRHVPRGGILLRQRFRGPLSPAPWGAGKLPRSGLAAVSPGGGEGDCGSQIETGSNHVSREFILRGVTRTN